ncbi:metallophosphoesterase [Halobium salinum]|uniref:Phosphoesterase n=1 Tax=Halobium salinum TaxID=1364940 RepID=A0ABD5P824_9EURY|nr:metallophosphoesterase [Halobium salinum]
MLVVLSDTHSTDGSRLRGRTLEAVREADLVVHAGDFMREPVLDAFEDAASALRAVYGNNDDAGIRERLPAVATVEYEGFRFAVVHGDGRSRTALSLLGRERDADAVVFGHSHRPEVDDSSAPLLFNPGSHAEPRGYRAAHAELTVEEDGPGTVLDGRLVAPNGETLESFRVGGE